RTSTASSPRWMRTRIARCGCTARRTCACPRSWDCGASSAKAGSVTRLSSCCAGCGSRTKPGARSSSARCTGASEMPQRPVNAHAAYHAHIYFGPETVEQARALAQEAGRLWKVSVGRVHEKLVGPHPAWSVQLAFARDEFDRV